MRKPVVGVMGASAKDALSAGEVSQLRGLSEKLGSAIARAGCVLITGATTGLPDLVARAFREEGGLALGISPAENRVEHVTRFGLPTDAADVILYTGFGYKGRNIINIRSSEIVLFLGGAMGTLNEFTIAYDEGKIIGVVEGSGGVADHLAKVIDYCRKPTRSVVLFDSDPERLLTQCLNAFAHRVGESSGGD